jgi:hypothetical protein
MAAGRPLVYPVGVPASLPLTTSLCWAGAEAADAQASDSRSESARLRGLALSRDATGADDLPPAAPLLNAHASRTHQRENHSVDGCVSRVRAACP